MTDMSKAERAGYLASLLALMEGQDTAGVHNRSVALGAEFNREWDLLKKQIANERKERETRQSQPERSSGSQDRADPPPREPSSRIADRPDHGLREGLTSRR